MFRRIMSLFMVPVLLLLSVWNVTTAYAEEADNFTNDNISFKGYEFQSYEPGEDDAQLYVEDGVLIYKIDKLSLEDWKNKVFIESGVTFEKGKQYTVDFTISADKDTYFSFFVNQTGAWNPVISEFLNIGDYMENFSYTTSVIGEDMPMEVLFQFGGGGNEVPLKISIFDFAIYETATAEETTSSYQVTDFGGLSVSAEGVAGSNLYIEEGGLVFETAEDGKVKIEDLSFKKGCDYEIAYTVRADKNVQLAYSLDPTGGYFAPGTFIPLSGEPQTVSRRTGVQRMDRQMEITFDISKAANGETAKIVFDQIVIKEIKDGQEQISRNAWVVDGFLLNHDESGGAAADFDMDEAGNVVYKIEKIGEHDWNNKVMIDRNVTFVKGNAYKVEFALETDKEISAFFGVNPKNKWEPKIAETIRLKEGVNEFSFTTDTQAYDEDMEVLFQFGGYGNTAPCSIKMKAISIETASEEDIAVSEEKRAAVMEPILVKEYSFSKLDNYKFKGFAMNDPGDSELYLEQGVLVYDIKAFGVNQLIKNDLWLGRNSKFNVEMHVSASRPMNLECYVSGRNIQNEPNKSVRTIGKDIEVIKTEFRTNDSEDQGRIVFDLSSNEGSGKFYVHSVVIKAVEEESEYTYPLELLDLDDPDVVHTDDKSNATVTLDDNGLRYSVKRFGGNPWENKITLNNIAEFKEGKTYVVDFDVSSTKSTVFTCFMHNLDKRDGDDQWEYFWERNQVAGGKKQHFRYNFKALDDNAVNEMIFELGGQGNNKKGSASIFISDIKITQCENYRNETIRFPGAEGVFSYEHNGSSASGSLYQEDGVLVYEIGKEGIADWHNQLIFNQGITFDEGYRYRVDVTASASKSTNMKFSLISQADGEEKIKKYAILSSKESTLSFETDTVQDNNENVEFSLRFGGMYNENNNTIKISDIKIYKINPAIACTDAAIEDDDLEIEYENSDFYECVDFKGYTFNSTLIGSADASLYKENGILNYEIREVGNETYHNKLSINHELTAKADKNYIIEITARADSPMKFFFAMNETGGEWNPMIAETIDLSGEYNTYTFRTNTQDADKDVELIFEFGANGNTAPNHAYIKDFKVSEVKAIVDEVVVKFKGNDFTHEETGETAKGILYTNDQGNMVYYASTLGNIPDENKVSMSAALRGGRDNKFEITLKPQRGLDVSASVVDAASGEIIGSTAGWAGDNETKTIGLSVPAQDADREVILSIMFGQTAFADARGNNRIEFTDFSITESEPVVDAGTVTFGGYTFTHDESGDVAKGILYLDDEDNMVYYAEKLGSTDWHNKVFTVIEGVKAGKQYTLTVEVEPEKGLDMVTTIPNAKNAENRGDAWYKNWIGENTSNVLTYKITAQSDTLEVNFQVGQENFADARENNHIVFKAIALEKNEGSIDDDNNDDDNGGDDGGDDSDTDVDAGTVTFGGYTFTHDESGDAAEGILYLNDDGNMVYYAKKLGSTDWHNKVFTVIEGVEAGKQYTLTVEVEPEKGLDMVTTIPNAKNTENGGDAWYRNWIGENTSNVLTYKITAQSDTLEVNFQVGQENFADAREDNHIVFKAIALEKNEGSIDDDNNDGDNDNGGDDGDTDVDAGTVTFNDYKFKHDESGDVAKGSLYLNDDGNMVYYAEKLSNTDWHNKVTTVIGDVEAGAKYTLMVEVELEKGLDMVTTIPNAKNAETNGDAWYRNWIGENTSNVLTYAITAQNDTLEVNFQFGQENFADAREDNHIVFKSITLEKEDVTALAEQDAEKAEEENTGENDPKGLENNSGETGQQPEGTEMNGSAPDSAEKAEKENTGEKAPEGTENNSGETGQQTEETGQYPEGTKQQPEETEQNPEETKQHPEETEQQPEETETNNSVPDSAENAEKENTGENVLEGSENNSGETRQQTEETEQHPEETKQQPEETEQHPEEAKQQPEETEINGSAPDSAEKEGADGKETETDRKEENADRKKEEDSENNGGKTEQKPKETEISGAQT